MIKKNPNRIQQAGFGCLHCGKNYKTRTHLNKHQLLCETLVRAKNSNYINNKLISENETTDLPTQMQMYQIIIDLSNKCNRLEEKMNQMQKWVDKTKKKINILDWLSNNQTPSQDWNTFTESIEILKEETEMILHHTFLEVFNEIINRILTTQTQTQTTLPIFAFTEKQNHMYIYTRHDKKEEEWSKEWSKEWREASKEDITQFMNHIHFKFVRSFIEWKKKNEMKINESDSLCELCNKANIKIMGTQFKDLSTYNKYRLCIYNKIKTDMKSVIEYELEF